MIQTGSSKTLSAFYVSVAHHVHTRIITYVHRMASCAVQNMSPTPAALHENPSQVGEKSNISRQAPIDTRGSHKGEAQFVTQRKQGINGMNSIYRKLQRPVE